MNKLVLAAFAAAIVLSGSNANAQANWDNRDTKVTVDTGNVGRTFRNNELCVGEWDAWVSGVNAGCGDGDPCTMDRKRGNNPAYNQTCCRNIYICLADGTRMSDEQIAQLETDRVDLSKVFSPDQSATYWGYVSSTNRSPNVGRTTSAKARLDVCLGATDTDTALSGGSVSSCQQYCGSTNYNDYCSANGAAVCNDRCECALNDPACNNL